MQNYLLIFIEHLIIMGTFIKCTKKKERMKKKKNVRERKIYK